MTSEPFVIKALNYIDAWKLAAQHLLDSGDCMNLVVHISRPLSTKEDEAAPYCHTAVTPGYGKTVYDVANTIFPASGLTHAGDLRSFFDRYIRIYSRGQRRHPTAWGTYFLRLVSFGPNRENQLARILHGLTEWKSRPKAAFVMHLSSAELDKPRSLGAPCWQYAQLCRSGEGELSLTAVYRSHDYFQKALGNFIGLSRLLNFICLRAGFTPGTLTCLSTYASLQGQQAEMRQLLVPRIP